MGSYGFFELINTLGVAVPTSRHWPMGDEGKERRNTGGWQVRPLTRSFLGRLLFEAARAVDLFKQQRQQSFWQAR